MDDLDVCSLHRAPNKQPEQLQWATAAPITDNTHCFCLEFLLSDRWWPDHFEVVLLMS